MFCLSFITSSNSLCCAQSNVNTTPKWWNIGTSSLPCRVWKNSDLNVYSWASQVRCHPTGSTVIIRRWQICPYHWLGGTIKKNGHMTYLGNFCKIPIHQPITVQLSRPKCIGTVALAKYFSQSVKICALVKDLWHKLKTCSTVIPPTENAMHSTGFAQCIRISMPYQLLIRR